MAPPWTLSRTTPVSRYQKGKTNLDLLEQEIVSGSGISWNVCKSNIATFCMVNVITRHVIVLELCYVCCSFVVSGH